MIETAMIETAMIERADPPARPGGDSRPPGSADLFRIYLGFLASAVGIIVVLLGLGFEPTRRLAGQPAIPAMLIGCLISLLAALVGTLPVFWARGKRAADTVPLLLAGMIARLLTALTVLVIAGASDQLAPLMNTLVVWLVISHAALLVAEIRFTRRAIYLKDSASLSDEPPQAFPERILKHDRSNVRQ